MAGGVGKFFRTFASAFNSKRVALSIPLGFAAGLPFSMRGSTLTTWFTDAGIDIKVIGMATWVGLFFTFKPLWAPVVDRYTIPLLGRRRGWMLVMQIALAILLAVMGNVDPTSAIVLLISLAALASFLTSTHDIATDAYRADMLEPKERAPASAMYTLGYRVAILLTGAAALSLAHFGVSWRLIYIATGVLMVVGMLASIFGPEPPKVAPPRTLTAAVVEPWKEFFSRPGAVAAISLIMLYKFGDYMAAEMTTPFLMRAAGYSKLEIAAVLKVMGMIATIVGAILGAGFVPMLGTKRSLLLFGVLQALMNTGYLAIAYVGHNLPLLTVAITIDWFCGGLATSAFASFQLSLCSRRYSATQFALIASASTLLGRFASGLSGFIIAAWGWKMYFALTMIVAIPGLLLILLGRVERAEAPRPEAAPAPEPAAAPKPAT